LIPNQEFWERTKFSFVSSGKKQNWKTTFKEKLKVEKSLKKTYFVRFADIK